MPDHAETFRRLHQGPALLLLANAWDAGSARLTESLGAAPIAAAAFLREGRSEAVADGAMACGEINALFSRSG